MALRGEFRLDVLTDEDYEEVVLLQNITLLAQQAQQRAIECLRARLAEGGRDAGQRYYYDHALGIVRRRDAEERCG